jgi:hypothetical protein
MNNLITVITRFPVPAGLAAGQMHTAFAAAAPNFRNVPNLIRKHFLLSPDGRSAGGVYLWTDEAAARSFMNEKVAPMIRNHFHVEPTMEYFESPVIVENQRLPQTQSTTA